MNKKLASSLVLVGSLLTLSGCSLFQTQNIMIPAVPVVPPPQVVTSTITSNMNAPSDIVWQTYTNTQRGFSVEYPSTWKVQAYVDTAGGTGNLQEVAFDPNTVFTQDQYNTLDGVPGILGFSFQSLVPGKPATGMAIGNNIPVANFRKDIALPDAPLTFQNKTQELYTVVIPAEFSPSPANNIMNVVVTYKNDDSQNDVYSGIIRHILGSFRFIPALSYSIDFPVNFPAATNTFYHDSFASEFQAVSFPSSFLVRSIGEANINVGVVSVSNGNWCNSGSLENGQVVTSSQKTLSSGLVLKKIVQEDAAAGNQYRTTAYSTQKDNNCYAMVLFVHTSTPENYANNEAEAKQYRAEQDAALKKINDAFETIVGTFHFVESK